MRCTKCGNENREGRKFCGECGAPLAMKCPRCDASNEAGDKFCGECGAQLGAPAAASAERRSDTRAIRGAAASAPENFEGERKTVTALFADIKGSTELEQDLDPEEARAIVDPALKLMIDAVQRFDGYVVQSTGDGIFALFGAPVAHEDHPQRALYAALTMQDELRRYSTRLRESGNLPLEARVGANTGEVVVRSLATGQGQAEYTPIGHTTNLASRMQALAPTGSVAISEPTRRLVEGYFVLKALGPARVKGVSEPVNVYEVTGLGPLRTRLQRAAGRGLTKFVGREREMAALGHAAEQAKSGHGQIVAAMAEAGAGKSRLFFEFKAREGGLQSASMAGGDACLTSWMVLETFSVSHGKASAYLPVIELLHGYFGIAGDDDARKRREKVAGRVVMLDPALEDTRPYLFALLSLVEGDDPLAQMDGQVKKRRTLEAIKRILLRESLNQPLMVIFEDLHWIDEETQTLLNLLADSIANARILLLVNYRPVYSHQWHSKTYYTQLRLDPLGKENAEEMLDALLSGAAPLPVPSSAKERARGLEGEGADLAPLKRLIIERTDGNPFFMEESVQVLLDEGALVRNGAVHLTRPIGELKIPPTVQAILAARIDRLPAGAKELLQALAVIGREFPLSLVRAVVSKPDDEISRLLSDLQLGEFIYEQPAVGDSEYVFKHALTQEVSYGSVLIERRKQLHERVGAALEQLYANSLDDYLSELAHHYSRSGNALKALEYHERAGRQAAQRSAYSEAIQQLTSALELLKRLPENPQRDQRELSLQTTIGPVLMITKGWAAPETERAYLRAQTLAETGGTPAQRFSLLVGLFALAFVGGTMNAARERAKAVREFTDQHPEPAFILETDHLDWSLALCLGALDTSQRYIEHGLAVFEEQLRSTPVPLYTAHHPAACGHAWGAMVYWLRGFPEAGRRHADQSVSLAHELGDLSSISFAFCTRAQIHLVMREVDSARQMSEIALAKAEETGFAHFLSIAQIVRGWTLAEAGKGQEGVEEIRSGIAALKAAHAGTWLTLHLAILAEAYAKAGRIEEGLTTIDKSLRYIARSGECFWEAEICRLRGELLLKRNPSDIAEAQSCFERAIEVARGQGAKSLELRAATSLARLQQNTHGRRQARAMLAEIYGWFTEGFDTADLKDAKALLEELQPITY